MNEKEPVEEHRLGKEKELRLEVTGDKKVDVTLIAGKAEIFGTELPPNKVFSFLHGAKIAIFTWFSCTIKITGKAEVTQSLTETPMIIYANTHACLEKLRVIADKTLDIETKNAHGPVTLVVGPQDVGKNTLCRILLNYAVRRGRRPIFVDLDVSQSSFAVPGTIGSVLVERAATVDEGFSQEAALIYNFGHTDPQQNMKLYNLLVSQMAATVQQKMWSNKKIATSGVFINTCGWVKDQEGYKSLTYIAQSFEVDVILVLDQERLYNDLVRDLGFVKVVYLPKSGGVVERTPAMRKVALEDKIREYFYGSKTKYHPHVFDVPKNSLEIYKIGASVLPDSCYPMGFQVEDPLTKVVRVEPIPSRLLAMTLAENPEELLTSNVVAYICVKEIKDDTNMVSILSTQPKPLQPLLLIQTEIIFDDSS